MKHQETEPKITFGKKVTADPVPWGEGVITPTIYQRRLLGKNEKLVVNFTKCWKNATPVYPEMIYSLSRNPLKNRQGIDFPSS